MYARLALSVCARVGRGCRVTVSVWLVPGLRVRHWLRSPGAVHAHTRHPMSKALGCAGLAVRVVSARVVLRECSAKIGGVTSRKAWVQLGEDFGAWGPSIGEAPAQHVSGVLHEGERLLGLPQFGLGRVVFRCHTADGVLDRRCVRVESLVLALTSLMFIPSIRDLTYGPNSSSRTTNSDRLALANISSVSEVSEPISRAVSSVRTVRSQNRELRLSCAASPC